MHHPAAVRVEKLQLLHDYLVVRPLAVPSRKHGSLIDMPEVAGERERSHRGVVLAVGPGDWNEPGTARVPMSIQAGALVFFGKYAGTEEEIGGRTVLVMRESECRLSVPVGEFAIVEHGAAKLDHLIEDWCDICHGVPMETAAKERLEAERQDLAARGTALCVCLHRGDSHAHGTGSCHHCPCEAFRLKEDAQTSAEPSDAEAVPAWPEVTSPTVDGVNAILANWARRPDRPCPPPRVMAVLDDRRPCAGGLNPCLFMQQKCQTADGPIWVGLRCGHWHRAIINEA